MFEISGNHRLLVTGGSGLLGTALKDTQDTSKTIWEKTLYLSSADGDLKDKEKTRQLFNDFKPTHLVHLAAKVGGLYANMNNQIEMLQDNLEINKNVVEIAHELKIQRVIFFLSTSIFPSDHSLPLTEKDVHDGPPHFSHEGYSYAKRYLEIVTRFHREKYHYEWVCLSPANVFGPNDNFDKVNAHVVPAMIHKVFEAKKDGTPLILFGTGTARRQLLYSKDVGRIIWLFLDSPTWRLESFHFILADEEDKELSIKELSDLVKNCATFEGETIWDNTKSDGVRKKTVSVENLWRFLPKNFRFTPLDVALKETNDWFFDNYEIARK